MTWQNQYSAPCSIASVSPDSEVGIDGFIKGGDHIRVFPALADSQGMSPVVRSSENRTRAAYALHGSAVPADSGRFSFTGGAISCGSTTGGFPYPATENWQKAIGAYSIWISGDVVEKPDAQSGTPHFTLTLVIHAEDRYNFNPGAADIATGIPNDENGVFEITGLAKQYMNYATLTRRVAWSGPPAMSFTVSMVPWARQRHTDDNRRLRNRL